jgi:hypothetical protein
MRKFPAENRPFIYSIGLHWLNLNNDIVKFSLKFYIETDDLDHLKFDTYRYFYDIIN